MRLNFDVRGDSAEDIQRRADQVIREFLGEPSSYQTSSTDVEINVDAVQPSEHPEAPMPSYSFVGHVSARIRQ